MIRGIIPADSVVFWRCGIEETGFFSDTKLFCLVRSVEINAVCCLSLSNLKDLPLPRPVTT